MIELKKKKIGRVTEEILMEFSEEDRERWFGFKRMLDSSVIGFAQANTVGDQSLSDIYESWMGSALKHCEKLLAKYGYKQVVVEE